MTTEKGHDRLRELKAQVEKDPFNVNLRLMFASALEAGGHLNIAVKVLEDTVTKARRNLGVALFQCADKLMKAKRPDEALRDYDAAIEADPSNATSFCAA